MDIQFQGITRITGENKAMKAYVQNARETKPMAIAGRLSPTEAIVLDGQDSVHFMKVKLAMFLSPEEETWLEPGTFAEIMASPEDKKAYLGVLSEIQDTANEVEEQQQASEYIESDEFYSLGELMTQYYDAQKQQGGRAKDGTPILDLKV